MGTDRLIDANTNRAAEGLRVLEDLARFVLDDASLSAEAKQLRHALRALAAGTGIAQRDTANDVGTAISTADEGVRADLLALVRANAARVQEALRAIEECLKLSNPGAAAECEQLRYRSYQLEQALVGRIPAARIAATRLYVLVDTSCTDDPVAVAAAAVRGGAGVVQLRAKNLSEPAYAALAQQVQDAVRAAGGLFVVNDHVAVAAALRSDGIHVGQDDLSPALVRRVVGPLCAIGLSTHTREQVIAAHAEPIDYLGIGPMFATSTKAHEPVRGPELLAAVRRELRLPSFAIGGLDAERIASLRDQLPHGVAVAGAVCRAADPERACAELCALLA